MTVIRTTRCLLLLVSAAIAWQFALADEPSPDVDASRPAKPGREAILNGESWRKTMSGLDEWFSAQSLYDRKQIEQIQKQLARRVEKMSPDELETFQEDLDAKLQMVLGAEGRDILGWVSANLAAAAPAYRKKMDLQYPDLVKLTAAQLREQLDLLERKRSAAQGQTAALEQARQARIAALRAQQQRQNEHRERALDRGAGAGYSSHYHPSGTMRKYPDVVSRPAYGFGYGFGFW